MVLWPLYDFLAFESFIVLWIIHCPCTGWFITVNGTNDQFS
jgi:hypothetical protein